MIPPARPGGNRRTVDIRQVMNGLMFILGSGCQWRTIYDYLDRWNHDGTLERIHHALYVACREKAGREPRGGSVFADTVSVFVSGLSHRFPRQFPLPSGGVTAGRAVGRPERTPLDGVAIMRPPPSLAG